MELFSADTYMPRASAVNRGEGRSSDRKEIRRDVSAGRKTVGKHFRKLSEPCEVYLHQSPGRPPVVRKCEGYWQVASELVPADSHGKRWDILNSKDEKGNRSRKYSNYGRYRYIRQCPGRVSIRKNADVFFNGDEILIDSAVFGIEESPCGVEGSCVLFDTDVCIELEEYLEWWGCVNFVDVSAYLHSVFEW